MTTAAKTHPTELDGIVTALAGGDGAFIFTFVGRYGGAVARTLVDRGAPPAHIDRLVHEVALALCGRPPGANAWATVEDVVAEVLAVLGPDDSPGPGTPSVALRFRGTIDDRAKQVRSLHLVDVDNLVGGPRDRHDWFATALREYQTVAAIGPDDQVVLAAEVNLYKQTCFDVTGWRYLPGYGSDGADLALLAAAPADWIVGRFDRLVIGSGDHAFAALAAEVAAARLPVVTVARPDSLSNELRLAATDVRYLPELAVGRRSLPLAA